MKFSLLEGEAIQPRFKTPVEDHGIVVHLVFVRNDLAKIER